MLCNITYIMSKRKIDDNFDFTLLDKLSKKKYKFDDKWISGTSIANYLNGEPVLDWLNLYYNKYGFNIQNNYNICTRSKTKQNNYKNKISQQTTSSSTSSSTSTSTSTLSTTSSSTLMSSGLKFESKVYDYLSQTYPDKFINIIPHQKLNFDRDYLKLSKITNNLIKSGVPIIAQAVLLYKPTRMRGIADLLIRSDFINKLFKRQILKKEEIKYKNKPYYVVIDIKWTSMTLCVDGETIRNEGRFKSYKGQLLIYNYMLGKIQGYTPRNAYIMAKNWKIDSKYEPLSGFSCFDLLGKINYTTRDNVYIKKTYDAIEWIHKVRQEGIIHTPLEPKIKEMCVNMSNTNDAPWTDIKKEIVKKTKDITAIWNITNTHRDIVFDNGIKRWDQNDCTTETLRLNDGKKARIIDKILEVNKQNTYKILPNKLKDIKDNRFNWQKKFRTDFYIDFETLSMTLGNQDDMNIHNNINDTQIIFMIGVGYIENDEFKYKVFKMNDLNINDEYRILCEFKDFIDEKAKELNKKDKYNTRLFHWSHAEQIMLESAFERHPKLLKKWETYMEWVDMCDIFMTEPIVVKGALCFKLKEIGNALYSHGLINTHWDNAEMSNGLSAMVAGIKYYQKENKTKEDKYIFNEIIKYNRIDVTVLYEIVVLLRSL